MQAILAPPGSTAAARSGACLLGVAAVYAGEPAVAGAVNPSWAALMQGVILLLRCATAAALLRGWNTCGGSASSRSWWTTKQVETREACSASTHSTHTARFLTLFCFTLPLVLAPLMGWFTIPASTLVAYSLQAIDESASSPRSCALASPREVLTACAARPSLLRAPVSAVVESPFNGYLPLNSLFGQLRQDMLQFVGEPAGAPKSSRL